MKPLRIALTKGRLIPWDYSKRWDWTAPLSGKRAES